MKKAYKTGHDWVGKVSHWELCKKLKFDHTNKWYKYILAPVLVNDTHKLLWDFEIHTDHLISARRPDLIIINKKKKKKKREGICKIIDCAVPATNRIKLKEYEKKDKYLDPARELKKLWNMKVTIIPIVIGAFGTVTKGLLKGPDRDKTINHIISECNKLAKKEYKTIHDWVEKVIRWELCKKLKFDHTNKCYIHNLEFVLENKMHKVPGNFEIEADYLISARRPDLVIVKKKKKK